jgi:NADH:ubiquinone oxidoreductase subunit 6 (subunit J)
MMTIALIAIALFTLGTAAVALALRNLIHSALLLIGSWAGIAAFYLWAGAEFVAFAQVLVYVVSPDAMRRILPGLMTGGAVLGVLFGAVLSTPLPSTTTAVPSLSVRDLGLQLMGPHAAALLIVGALLTVSLLGAVVIAATERRGHKEDAP